MSNYDIGGGIDVRIIDGPGVGTALVVADAAAETSLSTLAGTVASGKVSVSDAALEAVITGGALKVNVVAGGGSGASTTTAVAAAAAAAAVKGSAGTLYGIVVSSSGTAAVPITDGVGGKVIAVVGANQPVGDIPFSGGPRPFSTSLYANTGAGSPALTFLYT